MSDCPNSRHLLITRPDVLKARIGSAFSKIPKWFTCEVIVPFVITRLALLLVGWLGFRLLPLPVAFPSAWEIGPDGNRHAVVDHISPTSHPWVNMFSRWDAAWYLEIARDGYRYEPGVPSNAAFFPLYPLALTYFRALLAMDFGEDLISRTITYLLIFPTTFFFSVYSESSFLALTVAAYYYTRTSRWLLACILAALAP